MCTLEHCKQNKIYQKKKNYTDENLVLFKYNFNFDPISKYIVDIQFDDTNVY